MTDKQRFEMVAAIFGIVYMALWMCWSIMANESYEEGYRLGAFLVCSAATLLTGALTFGAARFVNRKLLD